MMPRALNRRAVLAEPQLWKVKCLRPNGESSKECRADNNIEEHVV